MLTLLFEGGNATGAKPLDIHDNSNKTKVIETLTTFFNELRKQFKEKQGIELCTHDIRDYLAGSGRLLFNEQDFPKKELGDIDIQIDKTKSSKFVDFLSSLTSKSKFGNITFIDIHPTISKKHQVITIWKYDNKPFQIDFEFVDFDSVTQQPTEFSRFSHSSHIIDLKKNIKGVFHKLLLRALTHQLSSTKNVEKRNKAVSVTDNDYSFSVTHGLTIRYIKQIDNDVYKKLNSIDIQTALESQDNLLKLFKQVNKREPIKNELMLFKNNITPQKDLYKMLTTLFGFYSSISKLKPPVLIEQFKSFIGVISLINQFIPSSDKKQIINTFSEFLWKTDTYKRDKEKIGKEHTVGQPLYVINLTNNPFDSLEKDKSQKINAMSYLLCDETDVNKITPVSPLPQSIITYYTHYYDVLSKTGSLKNNEKFT